MDFLNRAIAQVTDLFRSMTPGARITTGLLLLLVPISIAYLFTYHASGPDAYLLNGQAFQPSEMQAMLLAFGKANLNSYEIEGPKIRIPQAQRAAYLAALAEHNALPENFSDIMQKTVENGNFFIPSQQREEMHRAAIQRQLGLAIRSMTGIQNAYVMYDPDNQQHQFNRDPKPTASVSLKPMGSERLSDAQVHAIRALVSRAIAGLKPESVAIIDLNTGTECGRSDLEGAVGQGSGQYGDQKRTFEQEYKRNIQGALSYVPGVTVTANVELDPELSHTEETIQQDAKTVPLETSEKTHTSNSDAAAPGGRPGYQAQQATNAPMQLSTASAKGTHQEEEDNENRQFNVPTKKSVVRMEKAGLTPKRVTVSIGIPTSYFQKVWRERNPADPNGAAKTPDQAALDQIRQEEATKIREYVAKLLPPVEGAGDANQLVQVTAFQDITPPEIPQPTSGENTMGWLSENWTTIGMIGLAVFALLMLRSMVRSAPMGAAHAAAPSATAAAGDVEEEEEQEAVKPGAPRLRRFGAGGPSLRDELTQLVQEDPDAAANVLRTWIGNNSSTPAKP